MKELNPIILLPVGVFSFLAGAAFGRSRKDFSMRSSSPLPGVPLVRWKRFVTIMAVTPKRHVTPRHRFGAFGLDARRLSDVGFMEKPHKTTIGGETGVWTGEWKRPLTTDVELLKSKELVKPILSTRYAPIILNGQCQAAITGLATS